MMKFNNFCKLLAAIAVATTLELFSLAKPAAATERMFEKLLEVKFMPIASP
jgi:hypothetical protein